MNDMNKIINQVIPILANFDVVFTHLNEEFSNINSNNYPPYNLYFEETEPAKLSLEIAVAGFEKEDIKNGISFKDGIFCIEMKKVERNFKYLNGHNKLAFRGFKKNFRIPFNVKELIVNINNGILKVTFVQDIDKDININFVD